MAETLFAVTRKVPRFALIADVEVTAVQYGARLVGGLSELSSHGCYVDTPEGFPVGTEVRLSIQHGGSKCDLVGKAIYKHDGWGMGVAFDDIAEEQRSIIDAWLAELGRKTK
jgi:PilZ domain-containing protein